jgi:hypothetical protein
MSEEIIQLNERVIKTKLKDLVRMSAEETSNELLETEAKELTRADKYERTENLFLFHYPLFRSEFATV